MGVTVSTIKSLFTFANIALPHCPLLNFENDFKIIEKGYKNNARTRKNSQDTTDTVTETFLKCSGKS